jgi:hypothetical protein
MRNKWIVSLLFPILLFLGTAQAATLKYIVAFGDTLTDNGYSDDGGFGRFSNGYIWIEYLALPICNSCIENDAWAGARTDYKNYFGFDWSGLLWQIKEYKLSTPAEETIYFIWAGAYDYMDGVGDPKVSTHNVMIAIQTLVDRGAQNIVVMNLPNLTVAPRFNNPKVSDYAKFSPV